MHQTCQHSGQEESREFHQALSWSRATGKCFLHCETAKVSGEMGNSQSCTGKLTMITELGLGLSQAQNHDSISSAPAFPGIQSFLLYYKRDLCFPVVGKQGSSSRISCSSLCVMTIMESQDWKSNSSQRNQEPFSSFSPSFVKLCLPFTRVLTPQHLKTPLEQSPVWDTDVPSCLLDCEKLLDDFKQSQVCRTTNKDKQVQIKA